MDPAESPPSPKKFLLLCHNKIVLKTFQLSVALLLALDFPLKRFDESRNSNNHGRLVPPNSVQKL